MARQAITDQRRPYDHAAWAVRQKLRSEEEVSAGCMYEPSPGQLMDHVHDRVTRWVLGESLRSGWVAERPTPVQMAEFLMGAVEDLPEDFDRRDFEILADRILDKFWPTR